MYETTPQGGPPQPDYLNAVVEVQTTSSRTGFFDGLLQVEQEIGQVGVERWRRGRSMWTSSRWATRKMDEPDLQVPHPRSPRAGLRAAPAPRARRRPEAPRQPQGRDVEARHVGFREASGRSPSTARAAAGLDRREQVGARRLVGGAELRHGFERRGGRRGSRLVVAVLPRPPDVLAAERVGDEPVALPAGRASAAVRPSSGPMVRMGGLGQPRLVAAQAFAK